MVKPRPMTAWKSTMIVQWMLRITRIRTQTNESNMLESKQNINDEVCNKPEESLSCQLSFLANHTMTIALTKQITMLKISNLYIVSPITTKAIIRVKKGCKFDRVYTIPRGMYFTEKNSNTYLLQLATERIMSFLKLVSSNIMLVSIFFTQIWMTLGIMLKILVTSIISSMVMLVLD